MCQEENQCAVGGPVLYLCVVGVSGFVRKVCVLWGESVCGEVR